MNILILRRWKTQNSTISDLYIDGVWNCFILEDRDRGLKDSMTADEIKAIKVKHETAIPEGKYRIGLHKSPRFRKTLPHIQKVKGFDYILIHAGTDKGDSSGCLLPGLSRSTDFVGSSRIAFEALNKKIRAAMDRGEDVFIEIKTAL
jgi:hypothetical protein